MKKKTLLCTTIAGTMFIAGLAMTNVNAASINAQAKISANYLAKGEHTVLVQLTNGETKLTKADVEALINAKYVAKDMAVEVENILPLQADGTVGTGAKVKLTDGTELTVILYGDVNGDGKITVETDAQKIFEYSMGSAELTETEKLAADAVLAGETGDIYDAQRIFEYAFYNEEYATKFENAEYAEHFEEPVEKLPEELSPEIVSFEVVKSSANAVITVKLSKAVTNPIFKLNGFLKDGSPSEGNTVYTITVPETELTTDKANTLEVTDTDNTYSETHSFIYSPLTVPQEVSIPYSATNEKNKVNASNVNNATINVRMPAVPVAVPVTLEVTIKDTAIDTKPQSTITLSKELTGNEPEVNIENVDLSSLNDGNLIITARLKDAQGNVSPVATMATPVKRADAPVLKYTTANRTDENTATISLVKTNAKEIVYYLVKEADAVAPTLEDVLASTSKDTTNNATPTLTVSIENGDANKAYVVYLASKSETGSPIDGILTVKLPKLDAEPIDAPTNVRLKTGEKTTFEWDYDESTEGFVEYKAVLYAGNAAKAEKTVSKGTKEVDFFEDMKKAAATYTVKVTAVADNVEHANSEESAASTGVQVSEITKPNPVQFDTDQPTLLKWTLADPSDVLDYSIKVSKYDVSKAGYEVLETISTTSTSYDLKSIVDKYGIGDYQFTVKANAKENVLKASSAESTAATYYKAEAVNNLKVTDVKVDTLKLTGTLLPDVYSTKPTYTLYMKQGDSAEYGVVTSTNCDGVPSSDGKFTALPLSLKSLTANTKYYFKIVTSVGGKDYVSNPIVVTTKQAPLNMTSEAATYKKYEAKSPAESAAKLSENEITYKENTLYYSEDGSSVSSYSADENEDIANIIALLKQMTVDNEKIKIENNKVTELELTTASAEKKMTYDLGTIASNAKVTITGNENYETSLVGTAKSLVLQGTKSKFNLLNLTTASAVTVNDDYYVLTVANGTKVTLASSKSKVTINNIAFDQEQLDVTVNGGTLSVVGSSSNALTLDTTKFASDVTLNFTADQNALTITGSVEHTVKVVGTNRTITTTTIKSGKVDLNDNATTFTTIKAGSDKVTKVIIITDVAAKSDLNEGKVNTSAEAVIDGSNYQFSATGADDATYTLRKDSREVELEITASKTVTIKKTVAE